MSKMTQRGTVVMLDTVGQRFDQFIFLVKLLDFSMNSA